MKNLLRYTILVFIGALLSLSVFTGCTTQKLNNNAAQLSKSAAKGAMQGVEEETPALLQKLTESLKQSLDTLSPEANKQLKAIMDSLGHLSAAQIKVISASLNHEIDSLKGKIEDKKLIDFFIKSIDKAVGHVDTDVQAALGHILQSALDTMSSQSTQAKINTLLNTLIGDSTGRRLQGLTENALQPIIDSVFNKIDNSVGKAGKTVNGIEKWAAWIIGLITVAALIIIFFVWYERQKYLRLLKIMTFNIDKIPDQQTYDWLTGNIKKQADSSELDTLLQKTLRSQKINS